MRHFLEQCVVIVGIFAVAIIGGWILAHKERDRLMKRVK